MIKSGIDQQALANLFAQASADQGEALYEAVHSAMLDALIGRDLTLQNIRNVLTAITEAVSSGAERNSLNSAQLETLLSKALDGMDATLLQVVHAQARSLQLLVGYGATLHDKALTTALTTIENMECDFLATVAAAAQHTADAIQVPWARLLGALQKMGSKTGSHARLALEQLTLQPPFAPNGCYTMSLRDLSGMTDNFAALSGMLIGMFDHRSPIPVVTRESHRQGTGIYCA